MISSQQEPRSLNEASLATLEHASTASSRPGLFPALPGAAAAPGCASELAVTHSVGTLEPPRKRQSLIDNEPQGEPEEEAEEEPIPLHPCQESERYLAAQDTLLKHWPRGALGIRRRAGVAGLDLLYRWEQHGAPGWVAKLGTRHVKERIRRTRSLLIGILAETFFRRALEAMRELEADEERTLQARRRVGTRWMQRGGDPGCLPYNQSLSLARIVVDDRICLAAAWQACEEDGWEYEGLPSQHIRFALSEDSGATWGPSLPVAWGLAPRWSPVLHCHQGVLHLFYAASSKVVSPGGDIHTIVSEDAGATWTAGSGFCACI